MKRVLIVVVGAIVILAGCGTDSYDDYDSTEFDDPSNTVPGYDYGSLGEDYEYCKDVGNTYEAQGSGSNEDGYNACLDVLDSLSGG